MPELDELQTPESSEGVVSQDVAADEAEARSSGADQGDEAPATMLDAVRAVIENEEPEAVADSPPAERVEEADSAGDEHEEPADRDARLLRMLDELKDEKLPLSKIQRFREVLSENRTLKSQFEAVRPAVDRLSEINDAARRAGFTPDEVAELMTVPIVARDDPGKAHEIVSKFADRLAQATGARLPEDLAREVDDGYITEERAREIARLRAAELRAQSAERLEAESRERQEVERRVTAIAETVNDFQKKLMATDPSYTPAKHEMVKEALQLLVVREGRPESPERALDMAKRAHDTVTQRLKAMIPPPRQVRQPSGRRLNAPGQAAPKSMREAIERSLTG